MPTHQELTRAYVAQFVPDGTAGLAEMRRAAIQRFGATGVPGPRDEAWRYTNLSRAMRNPFQPGPVPARPGSDAIGGVGLGDAPHFRMVFVDGMISPAASDFNALPAGVTLSTLADAVSEDPDAVAAALATLEESEHGGLAALNAAMMRAGAVLKLADNTELDRPVHIVHVTTGAMAGAVLHSRSLILAGVNARADLVESFVGGDDAEYWNNVQTGIVAGAGAVIGHVRIQREGARALHTGAIRINLARAARCHSLALSVGARLARCEVCAVLAGEGADFEFSGGALVRGRQLGDITTEVLHRVPHCDSRQTVRNVLDDQGRSVFQGRIVVAPDAQKTAAHQSNRNLLLSERAHADTKPELQIFADDVKCSHGATVGDLDSDSMFYLQSRGISPVDARNMLVRAFVAELVDTAPAAGAYVDDVISGWLDGANAPGRAA